jgi:hypothetical protein
MVISPDGTSYVAPDGIVASPGTTALAAPTATNHPTYRRNCLSLGLDELLHPPEAAVIYGFQSCASMHRGALIRLSERFSLVQEH